MPKVKMAMLIAPVAARGTFDDEVIVSLGSNLSGDHRSLVDLLEAALLAFPAAGMTVTRRSSWWSSAAWPDSSQPAFVNGVALIDTDKDAGSCLRALNRIEQQFGRTRGAANSNRTLDLDLISFGRLVRSTPRLILPHPRAAERRFVMGPLAEIAPTWRDPLTGLTAEALAGRATIGGDARPCTAAR